MITLQWLPPPPLEINGVIQYYVVDVTETETGRFWTFFAVDQSINVGSLHPFYHYEGTVAAYTIGTGPYTETVIVQTEEAGKSSVWYV